MTNDNFQNSSANAAMAMMSCSMDGLIVNTSGLTLATNGTASGTSACCTNAVLTGDACTAGSHNLTGWGYWQNYYYPQVITQSYPVYLQERAKDEGKKAFEIIKMLQDKRFVKFDKVSDFIDCMDALIKVL